MRCAIYKVPDGKLLKIFLEPNEGAVGDIKITGDFFMHPEEKIAELEAALKGHVLDETALQATIEGFLKEQSIELFGADAASIAKTILMAAQPPSPSNS